MKRATRNLRASRVLPALLATALLAPAPATAQDLPDAETLIAAYVEALGGAEQYRGSSSVTRGTLAMPAMGLEGSFVLYQADPNQMRMVVTLPGIGEIQEGFDGEVAWSLNPITGPQVLEGAALAQAREQATTLASLRDPSTRESVETLERTDFDGEACWKVRISWNSGRQSYDCYSVETGLLIATEGILASPMGDIPSLALYRDYQEMNGRMVATRLVQRVAGQEQVLRISGFEITEVTDEDVGLPPQIRTLVGG
jgi:hypothetical protein